LRMYFALQRVSHASELTLRQRSRPALLAAMLFALVISQPGRLMNVPPTTWRWGSHLASRVARRFRSFIAARAARTVRILNAALSSGLLKSRFILNAALCSGLIRLRSR
jgi:hypothetical protein